MSGNDEAALQGLGESDMSVCETSDQERVSGSLFGLQARLGEGSGRECLPLGWGLLDGHLWEGRLWGLE